MIADLYHIFNQWMQMASFGCYPISKLQPFYYLSTGRAFLFRIRMFFIT